MNWKVPLLLLLLTPFARGKGAQDPIDKDQDGLPDSWERRYFETEEDCVPGADSDGDGICNLQEFLGGSHPLEAKGAHTTGEGGGGGGGGGGAFAGAPAFNDFTSSLGPVSSSAGGGGGGGPFASHGGGLSGGGTLSGGVTVGGGTIHTGTLSLGSAGLEIGSGFIRSGSLAITNGGTISLTGAGSVWNPGSSSGLVQLTKSGAGILSLSSASTYTGITTINSGTLIVTGGGVLHGGGNVSSSMLITGDSFANGASIYAPAGQVVKFGSGVRNIAEGTSVQLGASNDWVISLLGDNGIRFAPSVVSRVDGARISGSFAGLEEAPVATGAGWQMSYVDFQDSGHGLLYVPEPGSTALCGLGALLALVRRRR